MQKKENTSIESIERICSVLECFMEDLLEFISNDRYISNLRNFEYKNDEWREDCL